MNTIRKNQAKGQDLQEAVETAVESCIVGGVLADILRAQKAEVVQMVLEGFDQEAYEKAMKKEGYERWLSGGKRRRISGGNRARNPARNRAGNLWIDPFPEGIRHSEGADFAKTSGHL